MRKAAKAWECTPKVTRATPAGSVSRAAGATGEGPRPAADLDTAEDRQRYLLRPAQRDRLSVPHRLLRCPIFGRPSAVARRTPGVVSNDASRRREMYHYGLRTTAREHHGRLTLIANAITSHPFTMVLFTGLALWITLSNLGTSRQFIGYDAGINTAFPDVFLKQISAWLSLYAPGLPNAPSLLMVPWVAAIALAYHLGIATMVIQRVIYFALFFTSLSGSYFLFRHILAHLSIATGISAWYGAVSGALIYTLNPYTALLATYPTTSHELSWPLLPWVTLLACLLISRQTWRGIFALSFCVWFLLSGNPAASLVSIVISATTVTSLYGFRCLNRQFVIKISISTLIVLIVEFGAFLGLGLTGRSAYISAGKMNALASSVVSAAMVNSIYTSFLNLFRMLGSFGFVYTKYYTILQSPLLILAGYCFPICACLSIITMRRVPSSIPAILILFYGIIFTFLSKSEHQPASGIVDWLFHHILLYGIFRNSYDKLYIGVVFFFSMLISLGVANTLNKRTIAALFLFSLSTLAIIGGSWLFISGGVADSRFLAHIPQPYEELRLQVLHQSHRPVLLSVPDFQGEDHLTWYEGNSVLDAVLLDSPTFNLQWLQSQGFSFNPKNFASYQRELSAVIPTLPLLGVDNVLIHRDTVERIAIDHGRTYNIYGREQIRYWEEGLARSSAFRREEANKYYELYHLESAFRRPPLYATTVTIQGNRLVDLARLLETRHLGLRIGPAGPLTFVSSRVASDNSASYLPKLSVVDQPLGPGSYLVHVTGAQGEYLLTLLQTYDSEWEVLLFAQAHPPNRWALAFDSALGRHVLTANHVRVNGFANGWWLGKTGSYWIAVVYRPQAVVWLGLMPSLAGAILLSLSLITAFLLHMVRGRRR